MPIVQLSMPPSVNALWRTAARQSPSLEALRLLAPDSSLRAQLQKPPCFTCTVDIKFEIGRPDQRRRDLDNFATKAVLDLLSHHHVLLDDSQVTSLAARWDDAVTPGRIRACIAAVPGYSMGFDAAVRAQWIADTVSFLQRNLRP